MATRARPQPPGQRSARRPLFYGGAARILPQRPAATAPISETDLTMPAPGPTPATIETLTGMLKRLGAMLDGAGWTTRLQARPGPRSQPACPEPGRRPASE